jgi:hypothetical protein
MVSLADVRGNATLNAIYGVWASTAVPLHDRLTYVFLVCSMKRSAWFLLCVSAPFHFKHSETDDVDLGPIDSKTKCRGHNTYHNQRGRRKCSHTCPWRNLPWHQCTRFTLQSCVTPYICVLNWSWNLAKYWENPHSFNPDRFLKPDWNKDAFLPFSAGARACLGRK